MDYNSQTRITQQSLFTMLILMSFMLHTPNNDASQIGSILF